MFTSHQKSTTKLFVEYKNQNIIIKIEELFDKFIIHYPCNNSPTHSIQKKLWNYEIEDAKLSLEPSVCCPICDFEVIIKNGIMKDT